MKKTMQNFGEVGGSIDTFFDSFTEFIDVCRGEEIREGSLGEELFDSLPVSQTRWEKGTLASRRKERSLGGGELAWSGAESWDQALEYAQVGWPYGRELALKQKRLIEDDLSGLLFRKEFVYDRVGGLVDVPRFLDSQPDPFFVDEDEVRPDTQLKGNKLVRILYNGTTTANSSPKQMITKGAAVGSLVELLEMQNRRVELIVGYCLRGYPDRLGQEHRMELRRNFRPTDGVTHTILIPIKTAAHHLNLENVFFSLASPAMQRRFIFSLQERFVKGVRTVFNYDGHYGQVVEFPEETKREYDIIVPATYGGYGEKEWSGWVKKMLEERGIRMEGVE